MPTYQKGLCSEPCTVGRLGGLLTVANLNTDMTGWFGTVRRLYSKYLIGLMCRYCKCSNGHDSGQLFTQDVQQTVQLNYCTAKKHKSHKNVTTKTKRNHAGRLSKFTPFWREYLSDGETNAKHNSTYTVNKYGESYKHRTLAKSQTLQTNVTIASNRIYYVISFCSRNFYKFITSKKTP